MREIIFESENLHVVKVAGARADVAFVTFEQMRPREHCIPGRKGFGETFFTKRGFTAYHFLPAGNDWYHYPETAQALALVRADIPAATRVVNYGASMGGYAAMRFSEPLGAETVFALAPQASVDPAIVPWEKRWGPRGPALIWDRQLPRRDARHFVIYDPLSQDRRHIELLQREVPMTVMFSYFSDHHTTEYVQESGLLQQMLLDLAEDRFDPQALQAELWRRRRSTSVYHFVRPRKVRRGLRRLRYYALERLLDWRYRPLRRPEDGGGPTSVAPAG